MIDDLTALASEIAALREFAERSESADVQAIGEQLARQLTHALNDLADGEDALIGEMPWWTERRNGPDLP